jgi:hypothetical protein
MAESKIPINDAEAVFQRLMEGSVGRFLVFGSVFDAINVSELTPEQKDAAYQAWGEVVYDLLREGPHGGNMRYAFLPRSIAALEGILTPEQLQHYVDFTQGKVSYKSEEEGVVWGGMLVPPPDPLPTAGGDP